MEDLKHPGTKINKRGENKIKIKLEMELKGKKMIKDKG